MLKHKELLRILNYNPISGLFKWKIKPSQGVDIGDIAGSNKEGYIQIRIKSISYSAHRLAWFYYYGYWPENDIDHKDRIRHHNWITNLRESSHSCNIRNADLRNDNKSGIKGVFWDSTREKWKVEININKKRGYLGYHKDFDEAVCHRLAGEQCVGWESCDPSSPSYQYVKENIQGVVC